jgi:hypothetical protein
MHAKVFNVPACFLSILTYAVRLILFDGLDMQHSRSAENLAQTFSWTRQLRVQMGGCLWNYVLNKKGLKGGLGIDTVHWQFASEINNKFSFSTKPGNFLTR